MKIGLDTSVVVRLLTGDPPELAARAMDFFLDRRSAGDSVCVSDWVLAETYYALQHHYGISKGRALTALRQFISSPHVESSKTAEAVLSTDGLESARPGFIDRIIHGHYLQEGLNEVATFERSARKLSKVRVL